MSHEPSVTASKTQSANSDTDTQTAADDRGSLSKNLQKMLEELQQGATQQGISPDISSLEDVPDDVVADLEDAPAAELRELPDEVLDELPDEVTADLNYDVAYDEYVDDADIAWDERPSEASDPHPESAASAHQQRLEDARRDDRQNTDMVRSVSDTGHPDQYDADSVGGDVGGDGQYIADAEDTEGGVELDTDEVQAALDNEGQPLDDSQADFDTPGDQEPLDAAQAGQTEDLGAKNDFRDITDATGSISMGADAAGSRLHDIVSRHDNDHVEFRASGYIDTTAEPEPLDERGLREAIENGEALPRPEGSDAWGTASIAGREASIEHTRQTVYDIVETQFDGVDADHIGQLSEEQRETVVEQVAGKYQQIRDDVSNAEEWKPAGFGYEEEIPSGGQNTTPDDEYAQWFSQSREYADFDPSRTQTPTQDDVELVEDLLRPDKKATLLREAQSLADRPNDPANDRVADLTDSSAFPADSNAPSQEEAYERMLAAVAAGAEPDEAAEFVRRDVRSYTISPDIIEDAQTRPAATHAMDVQDLAENGVDHAVVEGTVTETRAPKSAKKFQFARLNGEVNVNLWEQSKSGTKLKEGDRVRITGAAVGSYKGNPQISDTRKSDIEIIEAGDSDSAPGDDSRVEAAPAGEYPPRDKWARMHRTETPAALGADEPTTDRRPEDGDATLTEYLDQSGSDSKTASLRHTGDREETNPWDKELFNTSWHEDQDWERPHEQSPVVPNPGDGDGALSDYPSTVEAPFHDCGRMLNTNSHGNAHCPDCDAMDSSTDDYSRWHPDIETGFSQSGHTESKMADSAEDDGGPSIGDVDADI
jgi:hypothetical protein